MEQEMAQLSVRMAAPGIVSEPFWVEVHGEDGQTRRAAVARAGERAVFKVPGGTYRVCVYGGAARDPGGQCRWVCLRDGDRAAYSVVFREGPAAPAAVVTLLVRDAYYPNIIPLNGGITVWQQKTGPLPL